MRTPKLLFFLPSNMPGLANGEELVAWAEGARGTQRGLKLSQRITSACEQVCTIAKLHTLQEGEEDAEKSATNLPQTCMFNKLRLQIQSHMTI